MSLHVLVAEDEAPQREALVALLRRLLPEAELAVMEDGLEALEWLNEHHADLAFLDVRMPGASGLQVAAVVIEAGGDVVFTTAYEAHAVKAFEQGAVDYLLKPLSEQRLEQSIARWQARREPSPAARAATQLDVAALAALLRQAEPPRLKWISATLGDSLRVFDVDAVQAFHAGDKMTRVLTLDGDALIRPSLKELLPQLDPERFWQVHRSLIVAIAAIDRVRRDDLGRHQLSIRGRDERFAVSQAVLPRLRGM